MISYINYKAITRLVPESEDYSREFDYSLIGFHVDLRDHLQLRIIQNDTTSFIVPENDQIRQIADDIIQIPNNAFVEHLHHEQVHEDYYNIEGPYNTFNLLPHIGHPYLPREFLQTVFNFFAIPVTAVYLVEHIDDRNRNLNM